MVKNAMTSSAVGSVGDVFKHMVLTGVIGELVEEKRKTHSKDFTFGYMETHSGGLESPYSHEDSFVHTVLEKVDDSSIPYIAVMQGLLDGGKYPSSWKQINRLMTLKGVSKPSLTLFDTSSTVASEISKSVRDKERIKFFCKDGYKHFKDELTYRTDFVFIDPVFSEKDSKKDWKEVKRLAKHLLSKEVPFAVRCPVTPNMEYHNLVSELGLSYILLFGEGSKGHGILLGGVSKDIVNLVYKTVHECVLKTSLEGFISHK